MKNSVVTVVLPIYDVQAHLERCLKSITNQTYENLEIILVEDGSPDNCPQICDKWAEKDKRIKVIHKKNAGLGMARNTGIENATGEYICFFDSDDYIALDTIEKAYRLAESEQAEIVTFGFYKVKRDGRIECSIVPRAEKNTYSGKEVHDIFLPDLIAPNTETGKKTNLWMSAWSSLYSMKLITRTNWRFVSEREIISEDIYSLLYLYRWVTKVAVLSEALYYYCDHAGSLTNRYRNDRYEKIKIFYDFCQKACEELEYNPNVKARLAYPYLSNTIAALKMIVTAGCSRHECKDHIRTIISDQHLKNVLGSMNIRKESRARKIFLIAMKYGMYRFCYIMIVFKSK